MKERKLTKQEKKALREKALQVKDHIKELMTACPNHEVPVTRRDFFERGLLTGVSMITLPTFLSELIRTSPAMAEAVADFPAIIQIHTSGGASLAGNAMGFMAGGVALPDPRRFGVLQNELSLPGSTWENTMATPETGPGLTFLTRNRIIHGIIGNNPALLPNPVVPVAGTDVQLRDSFGPALTAAELAQVQMAGILTKSADDGGGPNNLIMVGGAAALLGRKGSSGVDIVKNANAQAGNFSNAGPTPITAQSVQDFTNKVKFFPAGIPQSIAGTAAAPNQANLVRIAAALKDVSLADTSTQGLPDAEKLQANALKALDNNINLVQNPPVIDPATDTALTGLFTGASGENSAASNAIYGAMVKSVLDGTVGSAELSIGGCDYHAGGSRAAADTKDIEIGGRVRQAIKAALAKNKKTVIMVVSNGNNLGNNNNPIGAWNADQGGVMSMYYMILVTPMGQTKPRQKTAQLGAFLANGSTDPASPVGNAQGAARAMLVNVLLLSGKSVSAVASALSLSTMQVEEMRIFG